MERLEELGLGDRVQGARRLVDDEELRVPEEPPREGDLLPLARAQLLPLFPEAPQVGVVAVPELAQEGFRARRRGRLVDPRALARAVDVTEPDVVPGGQEVLEEVLEDDGDLPPQLLGIELPQVDAVDRDATLDRIVQAAEELDDRGLPGAVRADERHHLARMDDEVDPLEKRPGAPGIAEGDPFEPDALPDGIGHGLGIGGRDDRGLDVHEVLEPRQEEIVLVEAGETPEQALHLRLAALHGHEVHDEVADRELALVRPPGDVRERAEHGQGGDHLRGLRPFLIVYVYLGI